MTAFEVLFSFYGLLLSLAIASVAGGLGDLWRRRRRRPVGILLPLLGLYILLAVTQQWMSFWRARDGLDMTPLFLLTSLVMALPYGFTAHVMFPETDDPAGDGDTHFLDQRRVFLGVLMVPLGFSLSFNLLADVLAGVTELKTAAGIVNLIVAWLLPLSVLAAMIPARTRGWYIAGLSVLIADRLTMTFLV
ncbi:MAG: hypothetical protein V4659_06385 [Pseudomonadota bacterium]